MWWSSLTNQANQHFPLNKGQKKEPSRDIGFNTPLLSAVHNISAASLLWHVNMKYHQQVQMNVYEILCTYKCWIIFVVKNGQEKK